MQQRTQELFQIQVLEDDEYLRALFKPFEVEAKQPQKQQPALTQEPSHYDLKDIERDYLSECPPIQKKIRKNNKRTIITNRTAKIRRDKKNKLYIQMLQNRIFELQREIEVLRRANHTNKQTLKKNNDAEHIVNGFFLNKQRHYQKLSQFSKQADIDQHRFMEEYDILRLRQGAVGKDRIKVINYYFKQLSEIIVPDLHKYVLKTAEEQSDLFDPNYINNGAIGSNVQPWRKDMIFDLQLSSEKIFHLSQIREEILAEKFNLSRLFDEMYASKCKIQEVSREIEKIYDRLNSIFSPRDIAKCLCLIEKYKFQKGFAMTDIFVHTFSKLEEQQKELYDPQHLYQPK